jgi:hypothetical protein
MQTIRRRMAMAVAMALAATPVVAIAQDELGDLEVTMEIVNDARELDEFMSEMPGPGSSLDDGIEVVEEREDRPADAGLGGTGSRADAENLPEGGERAGVDDFEDDDFSDGSDDLEDSDRAFAAEDDFEEGEWVDTDEFDEMLEMDDDMDDMEGDESDVDTDD